jgi:hypothetical protein
MSSPTSPIKEPPAKTSYTASFNISFDIHHDNTKGRSIENVINDIQDYLAENEEFWETFPSVIGSCMDTPLILQNENDPMD